MGWHYYGHGGGAEYVARDKQTIEIMRSFRGKPEKEITIYRAVPKDINTINPGDWVTINKEYAKDHGYRYVGDDYNLVEKKVKAKDVQYVYGKVYSGTFKIMDFNKWVFNRLFNNWDKLGLEKTADIAECLADTEKYWNLGANLEIVFLNNMIKIMRII